MDRWELLDLTLYIVLPNINFRRGTKHNTCYSIPDNRENNGLFFCACEWNWSYISISKDTYWIYIRIGWYKVHVFPTKSRPHTLKILKKRSEFWWQEKIFLSASHIINLLFWSLWWCMVKSLERNRSLQHNPICYAKSRPVLFYI
jgi:hypothetical protein